MLAAPQITVEIRIESIHDERLIASAMRHPRIYPHITDDGCPSAVDFKFGLSESLLYLGVFEGEQFHGLFCAHPHNMVLFEVHTCLLPSIWGERAIGSAKACAAWLYANTQCRRIITSVPSDNVLALRLARNAGMRQYGVNPKSILRDGKLLDLIMLGMGKD